ncbi:MAG: succinate dehydrogenase/fumarate reductase iron-sulfur subunit, partial [Deltaproteobacteria bacterium]|nr:succinate dehydrogenase/fumarate reductase iron-sulfur subunit [Deltaproteobacteria bacterium]
MRGENVYRIKVFRYDPSEREDGPYFQTYDVRVEPGLTVLMVLLRIRDEIDGTLAFRSSCRSAVCGSCAMVINGKIDLACRTQISKFEEKTIILEPLPNMEIIKDLVVDMTPFWRMYEKVKPYLIRETEPPEKELPQSEEERKRIDQFVNCILCASCYSACPVVSRDPEYLGPHAFTKLERFIGDSRDERRLTDLLEFDNQHGLWGCDTILKCIEACPKNVRPTDSIVNLRKR